jgi:DNA (cytosine-5)-methyltransferase 1
MIGNAGPPILTYYIFQSMLEVKLEDLKLPRESSYYHEKPRFKPYASKLGLPARTYPANRKFQFSVPNLRYGSGVRFELSNDPKSDSTAWSFKFYHGNSKNIKQIHLNSIINSILAPVINTPENTFFSDYIDLLGEHYKEYNSERLQEIWTSSKSDYEVFSFLDKIGECARDLIDRTELSDNNSNLIEAIINEKSKKLEENRTSLLVGFYLLSSLNNKIFNQ